MPLALAPLLAPAIVGALAVAMGSLIGRAIIALGVGLVTYKGIDLSIGALKSAAIDSVNALPTEALNMLAFLWVDKALTVIFSAVTAALTMRLLGGAIKKLVVK